MSGDMPNKMLVPCIINILKEYTDDATDENGNYINTMTQKQIIDKLEKIYGFKVERKSFSKNLKELLEFDGRIKCTIKTRKGEELTTEDDDTGAIYTDFWIKPVFDGLELHSIIYNIIFARHIPVFIKKSLVERLEDFLPLTYRHDFRNYINEDREYKGEFTELFMNMEDIDKAISSKNPISFKMSYYKPDKSLITSTVEFIVMPLGIVAGKGDYYLLSCIYAIKGVDKKEGKKFSIGIAPGNDTVYLMDDLKVKPEKIEDFTFIRRIDRMQELKILEKDEVKGYEAMLKAFHKRKGEKNILKATSLNAALSSGRTVNAKFRLITRKTGIFNKLNRKGCDLTDVIDHFGKPNVRITTESKEKTEDGLIITYMVNAKTNDNSLREFAKTNIESIEVITPDYMREELCETLKKAYERMSAPVG